MPQCPHKHLVFVAGVHRSGTTLLHNALRAHPAIAGFNNTGKPGNEGQHLQSVFPSARELGGPGRFAFDSGSFMDETHPLATPENADRIYADWSRYWDLTKIHLLEKSPPTIVRTRFLQKSFPGSSFVAILRHPIPVAYATLKLHRASVLSLIEHTLRCYERLQADKDKIENLFVLRYEDFLERPRELLRRICLFIGVDEHQPQLDVRTGSNREYFLRWQRDIDCLESGSAALLQTCRDLFADRMAAFGYSFDSGDHVSPVSWIDAG